MNEFMIYLSQYSTALEIISYAALSLPAVIVVAKMIKETSNGKR